MSAEQIAASVTVASGLAKVDARMASVRALESLQGHVMLPPALQARFEAIECVQDMLVQLMKMIFQDVVAAESEADTTAEQ